MRFVCYESATGGRATGVLQDGNVVDVSDLLAAMAPDAAAREALASRGIEPATGGLMRWLQAGDAARRQAAQLIRDRAASGDGAARLPLSGLRLQPPVARPGKIVGVGRNYADHAKETGVAPFEKPRIIFKVSSSIAAPGATVPKPQSVKKMDFEGELAVVMGRFATRVSADEALDYVGGYTLLNDLSAREFQFDISPPQTTFAKSMDGFCPMGPALVTPESLRDPQLLHLRTVVNGVVVQDATTADMLFPVATLISYVSQYMTLEPGDVLATGTPAGIGAFRTPPSWLGAGDRIEISIDEIGTLLTIVG
ncbi:fumarylacetoacetate hydrolase family protein [Caenimonas terrae]|uniref:Fumarylacetoacetate hydrolase family protein n=1 Tax=Caenimonas terrae TaxID=696074 RepID=A0ABW0NE86_9BURK